MPNLTIVTDENLRTQKLMYGSNSLKVIQEPTNSLDSRISTKMAIEDIKDVQPHIMFKDIRVLTRQTRAYPEPTLMHFALAKHLEKQDSSGVRKVVDMDCGVGFLGNYAAKRLQPGEVVFADLNQIAVNQSLLAYGVNNNLNVDHTVLANTNSNVQIRTKNQTVQLLAGNVAEKLRDYDGQGQVAVAAPNFIPGISKTLPQVYQSLGSIAKRAGLRLFVGHSNLANPIVKQAAANLGMQIDSTPVQEVPFIVQYTDQMRANTQRSPPDGLRFDESGKAYHTLMVSEMYE